MEREPPNILVIQVMRPAQGGIRRHLQTLCPRLAELGVSCSVAAPARSAGDFGVPSLAIPIRGRLSPADLLAAQMVARWAASARSQENTACMLHGHGLRGAWIAYLASFMAPAPFVVTLHNVLPSVISLPTRWALARVLRNARAVIAVSEAVAASVEACGIPDVHPRVIPNGIDLAEFDAPEAQPQLLRGQLHLPAAGPIIAAAGRFSPEKGFHVLLKAVSQIAAWHPQVCFALAGAGPQEHDLKRLAPRNTQFLGYLPRVAPLFLCADIVAIPSLAEGHGLVALEAMAARRPVVASDVGGLKETILHGQTGLLVPAGDAESLANALQQLLKDADSRRSMGEAGRARVEAFYTADLMAARIAETYRSVAQSVPT